MLLELPSKTSKLDKSHNNLILLAEVEEILKQHFKAAAQTGNFLNHIPFTLSRLCHLWFGSRNSKPWGSLLNRPMFKPVWAEPT